MNNDVNPILLTASNNLNIVTWNVEHFPKSDLTIQYLKQAILSMQVDILVLQEIENSIYFNQLVSELGDNWIGYRYENSDWGELSYLINSSAALIGQPFLYLHLTDPLLALGFSLKSLRVIR